MNKRSLKKILLDTACRNVWLSVSVVASIMLSVVLGLLPPMLLESAVDQLASGVVESMTKPAILYVLFSVLASASLSYRAARISIFGEKITHAVRSQMADKLNALPSHYLTSHSSGETSSLFVNDVDTLEDLFAGGVISMIADLATLVGILIAVFVRSKGLGVLLLFVLPLLFLYTRHVQKCMRSAQLDHRLAVAQASRFLPETLKNFRTIHLYRKEAYMQVKYEGVVKKGFEAMEKSNFYDSIYSPIIITASSALTALVMILASTSGRMALFFGMSTGTAVAVIAYIARVFEPLESIGMEIASIQSATAGLARVRAFLGEEEKPIKEPGEKNMDGPVLEVCDLCFAYPGAPLLFDHFNLVVQKGEDLSIEGRTGCGKSTLFKILLGLYEPNSGRVRMLGMDPMAIREEERRWIYGYVEQSFCPLAGSIKDNITLKDERISVEMVETALDTVGLGAMVKRIGLDTPYEKAGFSQGQKQLLSIARAIVTDPGILFLDEITANLDSGTQAQLMEALKRAGSGRTVLSITHRPFEEERRKVLRLDEKVQKGMV